MGCYAFPNHVLPRYADKGLGVDVTSAVDALRAELPDSDVVHARGCDVLGEDRSGFAAAMAAAVDADVCIALSATGPACSGWAPRARAATPPTCACPASRPSCSTPSCPPAPRWSSWWSPAGPTPWATSTDGPPRWSRRSCRAKRAAGRSPGYSPVVSSPAASCPSRSRGGRAGSRARTCSRPLGSPDSAGISNLDAAPLYPFGHGRSYTSFEVGDLRLAATEVPTDGELTVSVRVRNTGTRDGEEVVQLYLHDVLAQVTRPVKQLAGFARVALAAGASSDVTFHLHADRTAFTGRDLRRIVEPGDVDVLVGTSATDLPCRGSFRLTGPLRVVGHDRRLHTPVTLTPLTG